jgi:ATP-dependent helicase/nuclease subunit A
VAETILPADQIHRNRIAADLDSTLLVEAGAGTGKTTCLVARMIGLLREGKCQIETLAAVTFTRKATAELRVRFQLELERAARSAVGAKRDRLMAALSKVERCFIGTIHSFCARLLRERPVEAGIDPAFRELDEVIDVSLREQAWREFTSEMIRCQAVPLPVLGQLGLEVSPLSTGGESFLAELAELGLHLDDLAPAFRSYAHYPDVDDWPAESVPLPDLGPCRAALREYAAHIASLDLPADAGNDELIPKYQMLKRRLPKLDLERPLELLDALQRMTKPGKVVQKNWPGKKAQAVAELERWNHFASTHAEPVVQAWREHRYEPAIRIICQARRRYDELRQALGGLNFQDLLLKAAALLRDKPQVRRYFRTRYTHLLVDEFQDTDPVQAEVMLLLTADDPEETLWQRCRPVSGSLFVVGDPKQGIYRFRRADIVTYNKVRSIIEEVGGTVVPLTANFRSCKPIIDWVNDRFSEFFPEAASEFAPAHCPLDVGRSDGGGEQPAVFRLQVPDCAADDLARHEADVIARIICQAIAEKWPVPRSASQQALGLPEHAVAGDFMIVTHRKRRLAYYAAKLQQYGLPHVVTGGTTLNEVPELRLLQTCLAALLRPHDPIALVAALRSELFGVPDTLLYEIKRCGGRFHYFAPIPEGLEEADTAYLETVFNRLRTCSRWLHRLPAAAAVERIAADFGLLARACAAEEGDVHAGSLLKTIELLRRSSGPLTGDCLEVLDRLLERLEGQDGIAVRPSAEAPVRVMNLHQCKGLEAPFVFLADPRGESKHPVEFHIDRTGERTSGYLSICGPKVGQFGPAPILAQPRSWSHWQQREQQFLDGEKLRLLYVAATRAGAKMIISQRSKNDTNPWGIFDTALPATSTLPDPGLVSLPSSTDASLALANWKPDVAAIEGRWRRTIKPTYAVEAIKASSLQSGTVRAASKPRGQDGGAEWGELLHVLLEAAMKRPHADLRDLAVSVLETLGKPTEWAEEALETVRSVLDSATWKRACSAERVLSEVPIMVPVGAEESSTGLLTVRRGVIDLAFREAGGWVLVDYKSERVETAELAALAEFYRPQMVGYATAWERATGQPILERGILFTHAGQYVAV